MPELSEVTYSRDTCVAAVRHYYESLTHMYLNESFVIDAPEGGWPILSDNIIQTLGKTNEVISLLRHLPYIQTGIDPGDRVQASPWCYFADWPSLAHSLVKHGMDPETIRVCSENAELYENVPPHVVSLTMGGRDNPVFLIDTELGIVHYYECPGEIRYHPSREPIRDDPYDYAVEEEAEWRADAPAWAITEFFEEMKEQFKKLNFVPKSSRLVLDVWATFGRDSKGVVPMLQDIYRKHGWPDLQKYNKRKCLDAIQQALEERYPGQADRREDE